MIALLLLSLLSYEDVLRTDLIVHAKIRWSKLDGDQRVVVEIEGGGAKRVNPSWSPDAQPLTYDLGRERELARILKWAKLPAARATPSDSPGDRTLEVMIDDPKKGWRSAGCWSMSVKAWQKGRYGSIFDQLEPLLDAKPDLFAPKQAPRTEP
jgi:hypothetical protein